MALLWAGTPGTYAQTTAIAHKPAPRDTAGRTASIQYGIASFYSNKFNGKPTATGERYDSSKLTAAHNALPFGTWIRVTNLSNKKTVVVRVNDRLHHRNTRLVDLSLAAAMMLGYTKKGLTRVKVEVLGKKKRIEKEVSMVDK
ncbi:MAG TPA: septal ring lytic transglycosylase RlpA family protein [Chitinophagaceae bacterium]|nr:septal ring lytic transglycosylase RlpA family protein [Chitinophagaceae bacterium]